MMITKYPVRIEESARRAANALFAALEREEEELDRIWHKGATGASAAVWNTMLNRREVVEGLKKYLLGDPSGHFTESLASKFWSPP